jgi:hypothetical protein
MTLVVVVLCRFVDGAPSSLDTQRSQVRSMGLVAQLETQRDVLAEREDPREQLPAVMSRATAAARRWPPTTRAARHGAPLAHHARRRGLPAPRSLDDGGWLARELVCRTMLAQELTGRKESSADACGARGSWPRALRAPCSDPGALGAFAPGQRAL